MTTQHTPGPWHIRKHEKGYVVYYTDGELRSNTAQCYDHVVCEEHGTAEANARLIAAAPELLSALQEVKEWVLRDEEALEFGQVSMSSEMLNERFQNVRAAIAKATAANMNNDKEIATLHP